MVEPTELFDSDRVGQLISEQMETSKAPGVAVAVVQDHEVVYAKGFGVTSVGDGGLPVTSETLFRIGSTTKPLTGTAIMRLVENRQLDLDLPVRDYVPWLRFSKPGAIDQVTMRMLLSHTSGLPIDANEYGSRHPGGLEEYVREVIPRYLFFAAPGKLYSYSNPGVALGGYVAEVASGKPYVELMDELVFKPLQMKRTTFDPTVAMTYPLAQSHDEDDDGILRVRRRFADNTAHYPAGFAISTVEDLANFAVMQMGRGRFRGERILSPESVAEMQKAHADRYIAERTAYGLTFRLQPYKGVLRVGHAGNISTFTSTFEMVPDGGMAIILVSNHNGFDGGTVAKGIIDQLLDPPAERPQPRAVEHDTSLWPTFVGEYAGGVTGLAVIEEVDQRLTLTLNGDTIPLSPMREDLYSGTRQESGRPVAVGFIFEDQEDVEHILVDSWPCRRISRDGLESPASSTWGAYGGTYAGSGTLTVRIDGEELLVHSEWNDEEKVYVPISNTLFASDWGLIEFQVEEDGTVSSLLSGGVTLTRADVERPRSDH